jgi:hypothetical protein
VDAPAPSSRESAALLGALGRAIEANSDLSATLVRMAGDDRLCIVTREPTKRHADIDLLLNDDRKWAFQWAKDGRLIGPADEPDALVESVVGWMCRPVQM